jgi:carbon monoxide dehydrogenase subunit G
MRIRNEVEVAAPPEKLFEVLADVRQVAPCLPGATLEERDGDAYSGQLEVEVGPITARYRGQLRFEELDKEQLRAVMVASGREVEGQGGAEATITAAIAGSDSESVLKLDTDLQVRGRAAQFGRGVLANVSQRLVEEFARNLEETVLGSVRPPAAERTFGAEEGAAAPAEEPELLDARGLLVPPMLERAGLALVGFALGLLVGRGLARR